MDQVQHTPVNQLNSDNCIVIDNVTKNFCTKKAVDGVFLTIKENECFGLLGANGAGKTTLFRMLTGDTGISKGAAWTCGYSVMRQQRAVRRHIAYCPQFEALPEQLTCRQSLIVLGLVRGWPLGQSRKMAENAAVQFDLRQNLDKQLCHLSGGNRRKLSMAVALSLITDEVKVVYMDEPTTGIDVASRRLLWNEAMRVYGEGRCVVLTTHSMEESEALCTRAAIMVSGKFYCLGAIQHLKNKFFTDCTLVVRLTANVTKDRPSDDRAVEQIEKHLVSVFPQHHLVDRQPRVLIYFIQGRLPWADMFQTMETAKDRLPIEDYSFSQASLEEVFLKVTKT